MWKFVGSYLDVYPAACPLPQCAVAATSYHEVSNSTRMVSGFKRIQQVDRLH